MAKASKAAELADKPEEEKPAPEAVKKDERPEDAVIRLKAERDNAANLFKSYTAVMTANGKFLKAFPDLIAGVENFDRFAAGTPVANDVKDVLDKLGKGMKLAQSAKAQMDELHNKLVGFHRDKQKEVAKANDKFQMYIEVREKSRKAKMSHKEEIKSEIQKKKELEEKKKAVISTIRIQVETLYGVDNGYYPEALKHARHLLNLKLENASTLQEIETIEWDGLVSKEQGTNFKELEDATGVA